MYGCSMLILKDCKSGELVIFLLTMKNMHGPESNVLLTVVLQSIKKKK